jgi:hypothetical protein
MQLNLSLENLFVLGSMIVGGVTLTFEIAFHLGDFRARLKHVEREVETHSEEIAQLQQGA